MAIGVFQVHLSQIANRCLFKLPIGLATGLSKTSLLQREAHLSD